MSLGMISRRFPAYALPLLLLVVHAANKKGAPGGSSEESLEGLLHPSDIPDSPHSKGFVPRSLPKSDDPFAFGRIHAAMEHILERVPPGEIQQVPRELKDFSKNFKLNLLPALSDQVIEQALNDAAAAASLRMHPSPQKKYMAKYREDPKAAQEEFPRDSRGMRMLVVGSGMGTYELRALPMFLRIPISPFAVHDVVSVEEQAHLSNTGSQLIQHALGEKHNDILRHLPLVPSERTSLTETLETLQDNYEFPTFDLVVLSGGDRDKQSTQIEALIKTGAMHNGTVVSAHGPGGQHDATDRYLKGLGNHSFVTQVHELEDGTAAVLSTFRVRLREEL